jgi:hypothetical protein
MGVPPERLELLPLLARGQLTCIWNAHDKFKSNVHFPLQTYEPLEANLSSMKPAALPRAFLGRGLHFLCTVLEEQAHHAHCTNF